MMNIYHCRANRRMCSEMAISDNWLQIIPGMPVSVAIIEVGPAASSVMRGTDHAGEKLM